MNKMCASVQESSQSSQEKATRVAEEQLAAFSENKTDDSERAPEACRICALRGEMLVFLFLQQLEASDSELEIFAESEQALIYARDLVGESAFTWQFERRGPNGPYSEVASVFVFIAGLRLGLDRPPD